MSTKLLGKFTLSKTGHDSSDEKAFHRISVNTGRFTGLEIYRHSKVAFQMSN